MSFSPLRHAGALLVKRKPLHLTFFVTKRCNARCPFCFYIYREDGPGPGELTLAEIDKIADSLPNLLWLSFSGGEIFVRKDFVDIVKLYYRKNKPVVMLFPTNGIMTDKITAALREICKSCPDSRIVAKISLDGEEALHDEMRGVKGCYRNAMKTYESLALLLDEFPNFDLGVNTVMCAKNQDQVGPFIDTVAAQMPRITTHTVSLARGEMPDEGLKDVNLETYRAATKKLEDRMKHGQATHYRFPGGRLKAAQDIVQRQVIYETAKQDKRLVNCYAGTLNLVLTETGDLHPCETFSMKFGNVRDFGHDVNKVLDTAHSQSILADIKAWKCHCTHECFLMTSILFNPRMLPAIAKEYVALRPGAPKPAREQTPSASPV